MKKERSTYWMIGIFIVFLIIASFILNIILATTGYATTPSSILNSIYSDTNEILAAIIAAGLASRFIVKRAIIPNEQIDRISMWIALSPMLISLGLILLALLLLSGSGSSFFTIAQPRFATFFTPLNILVIIVFWVLMFAAIYQTVRRIFKRGK